MTHDVPPRRWTNRNLVRERDPHRARRLGVLLSALILSAIPASFYLLQQNECVRLSYDVNTLRTEHERLVELERRLQVRRAALESLQLTEAWALEQHGMVRPVSEQTTVVRWVSPLRDDLLARYRGSGTGRGATGN